MPGNSNENRQPPAEPASQPPLTSAEAPRATNAKLYGEENPLASPAFSDKVELLQEIDAFLTASKHNPDTAYEAVGAQITDAAGALGADLVLKVRSPFDNELAHMKAGATLVGMLNPFDAAGLQKLAGAGLTAFALEAAPRTTRAQSMDVLSSQANIAGYKAVMLAANAYQKFFPMLMTAAGTVKAARVVILGVGVAGLQAIATAKRLGAVVEASDLRPTTRDQVESLGGRWLDVPMSDEEKAKALGTGGYAWTPSPEYIRDQAAVVDKAVSAANIVITTAQIPGRKAPVLVKADTVAKMKPGSVIVDMAVGSGGNVEGSALDQTVITENGVRIVGIGNIPALVATEASALYARNMLNFLSPMFDKEKKELVLAREDDMVKPTLVVDAGTVVYKKPN